MCPVLQNWLPAEDVDHVVKSWAALYVIKEDGGRRGGRNGLWLRVDLYKWGREVSVGAEWHSSVVEGDDVEMHKGDRQAEREMQWHEVSGV